MAYVTEALESSIDSPLFFFLLYPKELTLAIVTVRWTEVLHVMPLVPGAPSLTKFIRILSVK